MQRVAILLISTGLVVMTGCSINGKWSMESIAPEAARRDFEFASLTLQKDGTFYAESQQAVLKQSEVRTAEGAKFYSETKEPGMRSVSGTYVFKDKALVLTTHGGVLVSYDARLLNNNKLILEKFWQGQKVKAHFKRVD